MSPPQLLLVRELEVRGDFARLAIDEGLGAGADDLGVGVGRFSVLCRGLEADIDLALKLGAWGVRLSFPASRLERQHKLKDIGDDDYIARALNLAAYAKSRGLYVVFSPYDTTRAELPFLKRLTQALVAAGTVNRLRIVDTTGCALPAAVGYLTAELRASAPGLPLEIHCHDDYGLAVANTLAAVEAGADYVSTTINGLGERSGNAATEEVVMALEGLYGFSTGIRLSALSELCALVAERSGIPVQSNKPVAGSNSFRHEAGMVVSGVLKDPFTAEPYDPALVGRRREIVIGKKSGLASIAFKLDQLGIELDLERRPVLLQRVKEESVRHRRAITDAEFVALALNMPPATS